jgi:hypothetical protein
MNAVGCENSVFTTEVSQWGQMRFSAPVAEMRQPWPQRYVSYL